MKDIRQKIRKLFSEAIKDEHYSERLYDRFLNRDILDVGYEIPGKVGEYIPVGKYILPAETKAKIKQNASLVENYNFPKNKSYGIMIASVLIDKNQVKYEDEELKNQAKNKPLVFLDFSTQSNGNLVYLIVRNNEITTIYFAKSYVIQDAAKMRVDAIIKNMDALTQKKVR